MEEFEIINKYFKKISLNSPAACKLDNDVANFSIENDQQLIISKDIMVENIHFGSNYTADQIAHKLLASNLSDLASAGAKPHSYMLGFSKNNNIDKNFITSFCSKLETLSKEYNISLIGGDTVSSNSDLFFSITILGTCPKNKILSRSKARDKDLIFISGNIGDSYMGLQILQNKINITDNTTKNYFLNRHHYPTARVSLGIKILNRDLSRTAIDISDGLFADLNHICQNSKLSANIFLDKIPISSYCHNLQIDKMKLFSGGEDYELIFTAKENKREEIALLSQELNLNITEIVFLSKYNDRKIKLFDQNNNKIEIKKYGYEH